MSATPPTTDRTTWQSQISALRAQEKAHTRAADALAAFRRRLPMVEVPASTPLTGPNGAITLLSAFEGRTQLFASYHMWHTNRPFSAQCVGCTFNTGQALELSYLHARDVTFAVFCQGVFEESNAYRKFMGWDMPWYAVPESSYDALALETGGAHGFGMKACYLRVGERVFETYWTTGRGCEAMSGSYGMLDMMVYGRQEPWEDSPVGWPRVFKGDGDQFCTDGRPSPQWQRLRLRDGENGESEMKGESEGSGCC